jgi:cyclopropane fatty-acyl-phospholipid synthase-like methyltransferase
MTNVSRVGAEVSSSERWAEIASKYAEGIDTGYHRHRLAVIRELLPNLNGKTVAEFGCGEGVLIRMASALGAREIIGIDQNADMLNAAQGSGASKLISGGVDRLDEVEIADCLIAANVLGYLSNEEERRFYKAASRILPIGGYLVVVHSNELFDLFTFNKFTVMFFGKYFGVDVSSLLREAEEPRARMGFNIR